MGHLVHELSLVVDRLLLIAPTTQRLRRQMQNIGEDLVSDFGAGQPLNLTHSKFSAENNSIENLLAFDLGKRAGLRSRLQILGCSLEKAIPSPELISNCDALILDWLPGATEDEISFKSGIMRHVKDRPALALLPHKSPPKSNAAQELRARAQYLYLEKHCAKLAINRGSEEFLRLGLEWLLSF